MNRNLVLLLLVCLLLPGLSQALPRFSSQYTQNCHLCHVSPGGGGMRTSYGSQFFAGTELADRAFDFEELGQLETKISERLAVGADFRTLLVHDAAPDLPKAASGADSTDGLFDSWLETSSFVQMQGEFYLQFKLAEGFDMVYEQNLNGAWEAWALASVLPLDGSFRVGRFLPSFGWKFVDHNAFSRSKLGFSARNREQDTGVEFEFHPDGYSASLALSNGSSGIFDTNRQKALTLRLSHNRFIGNAGVFLGLSARANRITLGPGTEMDHTIIGPFYALNLGRFDLVGEAYLSTLDPVNGPSSTDALVVSQQFSWTFRQGYTAQLAYDFHDADLELKSGSEERLRLALDWIPLPWMALTPGVDTYRHDNGSQSETWLQAGVQLHFFL